MRPRPVIVAAVALPLALLAAACDPDEPDVVDPSSYQAASATIDVHFTDSSVPPEHHRSWSLSADSEQVRAEVTSYETPLADNTATLAGSEWEAMMTRFDRIAAMDDVTNDDGCAGGTTLTVELSDADRSDSLTIAPCGGDGLDQRDEVLELLTPLTDAVELQRLIDTEYDEGDTGAGYPPAGYDDAVALFDQAEEEARPGEFVTLQTESHYVNCSVAVEGIAPACEIEGGLTPDADDSCAPQGRQEVGRTGFTDDGIAEAICNSDTIVDPTAPVAFAGTLVPAGDDVRCYVEAASVTCANDVTTSGFYLSPTEYRTW